MRIVTALALLVAASPARAALDVCANERANEEERAYSACMERWRDLLPRAEAELAKPPPQRVATCDRGFVRWQQAADAAPTDHDAMVRRLDAREDVDRCVAEALAPRDPIAEARSSAHGWVVAGGLLLGVGGVGLTALGGVGIPMVANDSFDRGEGVVAQLIFGTMGAACAVMTIAGALMIRHGAHRLAAAR